MPKMKTRKSAEKRFSATGSGKSSVEEVDSGTILVRERRSRKLLQERLIMSMKLMKAEFVECCLIFNLI